MRVVIGWGETEHHREGAVRQHENAQRGNSTNRRQRPDSISSQAEAFIQFAGYLNLALRNHAPHAFQTAAPLKQVNKIASNGCFPIQPVRLIQQGFMKGERPSAQSYAQKPIDVFACRYPFVSGKNYDRMRQLFGEREKEDVSLPHSSSVGFESREMRSSKAASSASR